MPPQPIKQKPLSNKLHGAAHRSHLKKKVGEGLKKVFTKD